MAQKDYVWSKLGETKLSANNLTQLECRDINGDLYLYSTYDWSNTNIVKWDGFSWVRISELGMISKSLYNFVYDLESFNNELYISGAFQSISAFNTPLIKNLNIVRYDGKKYNTLPSYPNTQDSFIHCDHLKTFNDELYYTAKFRNVISKTNYYSLYKINKAGITTLIETSKNTGDVFSFLEIIDKQLVLGGTFDSINGGVRTSSLAFYDGNKFTYTKDKTHRNIKGIYKRNDSQFIVLTNTNIELWEHDSLKKDISSNQLNVPNILGFTFSENYIFSNSDYNRFYFDMDSLKWFQLISNGKYAFPTAIGPNRAITIGAENYNIVVREIKHGGSILKGNVFADLDSNCVYTISDINLSNVVLEFSNKNNQSYCVTNSKGEFELALIPDTYKIIPQLSNFSNLSLKCFNNFSDSFVINDHGDTAISIPIKIDTKRDLSNYLIGNSGFRARQGFTEYYTLNCINNNKLDSIIMVVKYPKNVSFEGASAYNYSNTPNELLFKMGYMGFREIRTIQLKFKTDVSTSVLGETLTFTSEITNSVGDNLPSNNVDTLRQKIVASYDPNIKQCYPEKVNSPALKKVKYIVNFQNTGNDKAYNIYITDSITDKLDLGSLRVTGTSHPGALSYSIKNNNILVFNFENIMLPDNKTNEKESHGFVAFDINMKTPLELGDSLNNKAFIYFDYQKPIITNVASVVYTKDGSSGIKNLDALKAVASFAFPNPNNGNFKLQFPNQTKKIEIEVYNVLGEMILKEESIENGQTIDLSKHPNGIYIVKIIYDSVSTEVIKLIKE